MVKKPGDDDQEAGSGRPPKHTRSKKGQCGNPNKVRKKRAPKSAVELIDVLFAEKTTISEKGLTQRITKLELITRQLMMKAQAGDVHASRVLRKYNTFAVKRNPESCRHRIETVVVPEQEKKNVS
jgi:hypothetical protein